ncbi:MAG: TonB-dependent receptor [Terracidiphilus sp.]
METPPFLISRFARLKSAFSARLLLLCASLLLSRTALAGGQPRTAHAPVVITVVDETGVAVAGTQVTIVEPGLAPVHLWTDYAGHCAFVPPGNAPYRIEAQKPGFYQAAESGIDPTRPAVRVVLAHEQIVKEQVNVTASPPGIDTQQVSNASIMNTPEIVNIPYQTSRDIRYLLPFNPGIVQGAAEQVHVAGSEIWQTLYLLDGFDIRSPENGTLDMRVSTDAVRTIDAESTRYPVQFGPSTGGVIAFYTGMGDNKFRFNATNFIPSWRSLNGIHFDKFVPRFTFSGPIIRSRVWFFDGLETEFDNNYISELPANADTNPLIRGSNLIKVQANLTPAGILTAGLLFNDYHSPYEGLSSLVPRVSTTDRDVVAWLPYVREQWSFKNGALLDVGAADMRFRDGHEPRGTIPYQITPELSQGSYFENETGRSQRTEATAALYLPPRRWLGTHDLQAGIDLDHIGYDEDITRAPVSYLREDGTLARQSIFAPVAPFTLHNFETGAYLQDRWQTKEGLLVEPGLRFDWDEIVRRPLFSPRIAAVYSPPGHEATTKLSAGVGLYYGHTQLEYLTRALAGVRYDTYYQADGITPADPAQETEFTANDNSLNEPRAINWSLAAEQRLPGSIYAGASFMQKRTTNIFNYANQSGQQALSGDYILTNSRQGRYNSIEIQARRYFTNGYTLFGAYTHSSARTNAALDYLPTPSPLGPQQSGPLAWDTPNRVLSWGWLPLELPKLRKHWDFVYTMEWHTGFPYTSVDDTDQVAGAAGSRRFPNFVDFSPGVEWKFHFRGQYWGLRGVMENATSSNNPAVVNNVIDSPQYGAFSEFQGRALTARIRLIGAK